jgi:hypothetical protein
MYYCQPKKDGILLKLYGMLPRFHVAIYILHKLSPVYGIIFLQLIQVAMDSLAAFYLDTGGWGQSDVTSHSVKFRLTIILPAVADPMSEPGKFFTKFEILKPRLAAAFSVQLFFIWRIFLFSGLYFGIKIKRMMFAICIFILLVSPLHQLWFGCPLH